MNKKRVDEAKKEMALLNLEDAMKEYVDLARLFYSDEFEIARDINYCMADAGLNNMQVVYDGKK